MTTGVPSPTYPARPRPRRSRLRTFLPLGLAAWLVLEIWLLTAVAGAAGGLTVFLLLVAGFVLGAVVIKRAGRRAFQNLNEALQRGTTPSQGGGNGLMMLGGLLLMIPGLFSDAIGLLLLLPPVQKALSAYGERKLRAATATATPGSLGDAFQQARIHRPDGKVVQGEVIRDEQ
ncbi:FxsA family protein [Streptomyces sp. NBC_01275]|uniref:FxsA family membrane protein n=1 Tax=Streptomyces sp. NBC_01275 TaxID=2903807 RepID=UPI0022507CA7|nr:FxsA family membrane protein [Streptomyces sp. NBC_01275]MCX4760548.1 FxsA family protein [Streptomyces sp. NBC_01275]